jgi:hypothetical protein
MDSLDKRPKLRKRDVRLGAWNERNQYRAGSLTTVAKEMSKYLYNLDSVGQIGQEWHRTSTRIYIFLWKDSNELCI